MVEENVIKNESVPLYEEKYTLNEDIVKVEPQIKRSDTIYLMFSVFTGILLMLAGGSVLAWSSPAVVILKSNDSTINPMGSPITTLDVSLITGVPYIAGLVGGITLPILADLIGRKISLQVFGLGMLLPLIGIAYSTNVIMLVSCSSLVSLFFYGCLIVLPMYLLEICEDHNRAKYGCMMAGFIPVGQLYMYIIGLKFSIRIFTLLAALPIGLFLILTVFTPESPVYLLSKGRKEECKKNLKKLRSNKTDSEIDIELYKITQSLSSTKDNDNKKQSFFAVFKSKEGRLGFCLALLPVLTQYLCGVPIVMALLAPIFDEAGISLSGNTVAIIVGVFKVSFYTVTSMLVEKTGRKPMLLISSSLNAVAIAILGIYFYLKHINSPLVLQIQWLPLTAILAYILFYSLGLGPIPMAITSELFPTNIRSAAVSMVTTVSGLALALYVFAYPLVAELCGTYTCMWIFSTLSFTGFLLMYFYLPETKGKSVHELQEMLNKY